MKVDEFRVYDTALSHPEIVYIAAGDGGHVDQPISPVLTQMDIVSDGIVDLEDFAKVAEYWLAN